MNFILKDLNQDYFILILFIVVMLVVFVSMVFFNKKKKIIRLLKKIPSNNIGSLKLGKLAKIRGKVLNIGDPLIAPLSNQNCVFYNIKIENKKRKGKNNYWNTLVNEDEIQDFLVEKNGDILIIKPTKTPKNYNSFLTVDKKTIVGYFNDFDIEIQNRLKKYQIKQASLNTNMKFRYSETIIKVGRKITVAGIAKQKSLNEPINGYSYSKITTLESVEKQKVIITDLPNLNSKRR